MALNGSHIGSGTGVEGVVGGILAGCGEQRPPIPRQERHALVGEARLAHRDLPRQGQGQTLSTALQLESWPPGV